MTCTNVPLNIQTDAAIPCSLKCLFHYKYGDSACTIRNENTVLVMSYDGASDIVFNSVKYTPTEIRIYKPSLHTYSGSSASAELVILHTSNIGGLLVCIPITIGGAQTRGSYLLSDLLAAAPSKRDETTSPTIPDFNANYFIPKSRYFTYEGPLPYVECSKSANYNYVVFHKRFGSIPISNESFKILDALLNQHLIAPAVKTDISLYVNTKGTTSNGFAGEDQIYIDCQPTGHSVEEVVTKDAPPAKTNDAMMSIIIILIGILLIFGTFSLMKFVLGKVSKSSLPIKKINP